MNYPGLDALASGASAGDNIASFTSPPVAEVVAAVRFTAMSDPSFFAVAEFWSKALRSSFPTFELQPPYAPPEEQMDIRAAPRGIEINVGNVPPLPRLWLTSGDGQEILQIQPNWFAANWRKVQPSDQYARWPARRSAFDKAWGALREWLEGRGEKIAPTQCEVTYINHIVPQPGLWIDHRDAGAIFTAGIDMPNAGYTSEQFAWQGRFLLPGPDGNPIGRVHVSIQPAFLTSDASPVVIMEITARSAPFGTDRSGILETLDSARQAVVRTFDALTSSDAHRAWGKQ